MGRHVDSIASEQLRGDQGAFGDDERRIRAAVQMARRFVDEAARQDAALGRRDRRRRERLATLIASPSAADFTVQLTDQVVRIAAPRRAADRFAQLVSEADLSDFSATDRWLLRSGARIATLLPNIVMPLITRRLRAESAEVILSANEPDLGRHLAARAAQGARSNVNVLGEAIVGDAEAHRRLEMVADKLRRADVTYVSVKISAICAGINPLAFDDTVARVAVRLRSLYRLAASFDPPKFVNLDMEEFRDLALTVAVFQRVLDEPEFERYEAGIVLQAYLPDVRDVSRVLADWALERRRRGGAGIKIRIVKGANLAMETVEAELKNWVAAPYADKADVDANYKAVLDVLCDPTYDDAVRVGVASHNLFDVAWALGRRDEMTSAGRPDRVEIEMLEGMAPAQADAVSATAGGVLLYAPVVAHDDFAAAIAYLVRRLDENTSHENFLSHLFQLADDEALFRSEAEKFATAVRRRGEVPSTSRRNQDRGRDIATGPAVDEPFVNAADTEWTNAANRSWIADQLATPVESIVMEVPTTVSDIDHVVRRSIEAQSTWESTPPAERAAIINRVGDEFETQRGRILATMVADAGKTVSEGDPEVSEAVDFARYYARHGAALDVVDGARSRPLGTVVIASPWNFPFAIPAGGVLAALAAGNTVILKPAPQTVVTAALIAELCWRAGVPREVLQFVPAADDETGRRLITHPEVSAVILTGAFETARMFLDWRPELRLHAETSGKNAMVITASADVDHAVSDLVKSAFGHAGQKCSAASLAIIEAPLYDSPAFMERLRDAAATLRVGASGDLAVDVGPLIERPSPSLERALTELDPGESWLLEPSCLSRDRRSWSPGIRLGVESGSWFARTECFGPVLGLIRATDLDHAIAIQNSGDFGLTAGIQALDPREVATWSERVEAGNLYVNRGITGAIVQRQPFGGWKRSVVGPAAKAGGPNYVASLCEWDDDPTVARGEVEAGFRSWMRDVGRRDHDATGLRSERNVFRYRPLPGWVLVYFGPNATDRDRELVDLAVTVTGCRVVVASATDGAGPELAARLGTLGVDRARLLGLPGDSDESAVIRRACHVAGVAVDTAAPVSAAAVELPRWLREQAVSTTLHRHGRTSTGRMPVATPG